MNQALFDEGLKPVWLRNFDGQKVKSDTEGWQPVDFC